MVHKLGKSEYGLFNIIGSFVGYLGIMDLGMSDSVVRYVARYRAWKDKEGEEKFLAFIFMLYLGISVVVVTVGLIILAKLPVIFGRSLTAVELSEARIMFIVLLINVTATILLNSISATIVAYERFVLLRTLEIASSIISTVVIIIFLMMGYKAVAVVVITTVINLSILLFKVFYAFFRLKIRMKMSHIEWPFVAEIFNYAMSIFVVVIVEQVYWKLDNVILGVMTSTSVVAVYALGMSFHKYFMSFSTAISKVMMPKIVQRVELGADGKELTDLLISLSRIQAIILMLILSGLIIFGEEFIVLWVGPDYRMAYMVLLVTLIPYSLDLMGNIRNSIMQAKAIYWYRAITILIISILNIAATILMIRAWGMIGAAIATGAGILMGYIAVNIILALKVKIEIGRYHKELAKGLLPAILLSSAAGVAINLLHGSSWTIFILKSASYTIVYAICIWFIGMNDYEKSLIKSLIPIRRISGT